MVLSYKGASIRSIWAFMLTRICPGIFMLVLWRARFQYNYFCIVYNIGNSLTCDSLKRLCNCMIYLSLIYGNIIRSSICKTKLKSFALIKKKIVRMLAFKRNYEHTKHLFQQFNLLKKRIYEYMSFMYLYTSL